MYLLSKGYAHFKMFDMMVYFPRQYEPKWSTFYQGAALGVQSREHFISNSV